MHCYETSLLQKIDIKHLKPSCQIFQFKDLKLGSIFFTRIWDFHLKDFHPRTWELHLKIFPSKIWFGNFIFQLKDLSSRPHSLPLKGLRCLSEIFQLKEFNVSSQIFRKRIWNWDLKIWGLHFFPIQGLVIRIAHFTRWRIWDGHRKFSSSHNFPTWGFDFKISVCLSQRIWKYQIYVPKCSGFQKTFV